MMQQQTINKEQLLSILEENNKGEAGARAEYYDLLNAINNCHEINVVQAHNFTDQIREIISDEQQHSARLRDMIHELSGIADAKG